MSFDFLSAAALAVVLAIYVGIFVLRRRKADFTLTILGCLLAGGLVGFAFQGHTDWVLPFGKIYVTVLAAIVIPLIAVSILSSVTSLGSIRQLKGIGLKSVLWLMVTNAVAIVLAIGLGLVFGVGKNSNLVIEGVDATNFEGSTVSFSEVLIGFFPRNIFYDAANDHIIPVILFTVLIAVAYVLVASRDRALVAPFKDLVEAVKAIIFKAVTFIIELTPYAVVSLVAVQSSRGFTNTGIIWSLLVLLAVSFIAFAIDTWAVNAVLLKSFANVAPLAFFRKIVPAQVVAFSTQSSTGTLPVTTRILTERVGVSPEVANFTAPLGTTIGMPGCAGIWPVLTAIYGVHGLGINYGVREYLVLAVMALFVSLGTAGVPGTATVVTASVLTAVGLPLEVMVLTIPISAIADTGRTATNVTGAMVASTIVAHSERELDRDVFGRPHARRLDPQPAGIPAHA
ncbi:MAG TPA: dicarboxylate/amino acid:cation symporter [Propionicimonas sp.]|nr:dicarboxylate/amino acid:cation symporter [Propionicimonas sp.]HRA06343.1 dicarboxylate/amino acid:cation symporter [Propionicimonas sp.]